MRKTLGLSAAIVLAAVLMSPGIEGQAPAQMPAQPMSFFMTSVGPGDGANLGGLAGADAHCQSLAAAAGRGAAKWVAYLSTQGAGAVNARDRIGKGPWYNQRGQMIAQDVAELHGDTIDQARLGNRLGKQLSLTEKGGIVNGVGDKPNEHDIILGSDSHGRARASETVDTTCSNYTSNQDPPQGTARGQGAGVWLGHFDRTGGGNSSWNAAHKSAGCSQMALVGTGGAGLLYCFAAN